MTGTHNELRRTGKIFLKMYVEGALLLVHTFAATEEEAS
jgi:hypothetical protein